MLVRENRAQSVRNSVLLYVIHTLFRDHSRAVASVPFATGSVVIDWKDFGSIKKPSSGWYMYLYDSEELDRALQQWIPKHLELQQADSLVLFKKVMVKKEWKVFTAPRIFRAGVVRIMERTMLPQLPVTTDRILDGWVLEDGRK